MAELYPFPEDLFTTNRPQTDKEWATLKRLLTIYDRQIAIINEEISDRQNEKTRILKAIAPFRRALSPFRRLPADIIREIFSACIDRTRNPTLAPNAAPTLLTHISSGLRHLALSTPEFWTTIHIPITKYVKGTTYAGGIIKNDRFPSAHGVEEWLLRRSEDMPLNISVDELDSGAHITLKCTNAFTDEIVRIMLLCRSRWKNISLGLVSGSLLHFQNVYSCQIPLLRSISLTGKHAPVSTVWAKSWMLAAPSLEKFYIDLQSIRHQGNACQLKVNWEKLTHLSLGGLKWAPVTHDWALTLLPIILRTTRLVKLKISVFAMVANISPLVDIHLPFLEVLEADDAYFVMPSEGRTILELIKAPKLRTLIYSSTEGPGELLFPPPSLVSLLTNAQEVKELSISFYNNPSPEEYRRVLGLCPQLAVLRIQRSLGIDGSIILPELVLNDGKKCLCPNLEAFWCSSRMIVTPEIIHEFISRKTDEVLLHLKPLKALNIYEIILDTAKDRATYDLAATEKLSTRLNEILSTPKFSFDQQAFWDDVRVYNQVAWMNNTLP